MSVIVLDTDVLTLYYHGDATVVRRVDAHLHSKMGCLSQPT
jgi:hypothetical protein